MSQKYIDYTFAEGAARITLVNGDRGNPVHPESADQLLATVLRAKADGARVIVLASEGRFFSVGGALDGFAVAEDPGALLLELAEGAHRVVTELMRCDAIVVSVVQGTAAGIGFPIAAAADIVLAADSAKFSLAYAKVGLSPDGGGSMLVHTLGLHRVLRLALLGDLLTAQEAYDAGLIARLVSADELASTVNTVVAGLLAGSAEALAATKRLVRDAAEPTPESKLRKEAESISRLCGSASGQEGIQAFLEKRVPQFN
ncbi:enoyl-CoA hydratase/isomerase family protein [Mycolicibacterium goodii]|uniref:enoyl-CoA hydratase/isomerase family protein n=1 Tax=Mycolicibacterium goodii TaxID=134601 RepID=UPI001BDC7243|nr:enoyl-CoA hydratase-related protein [Mycolicibacterium goodii]MBU8816507.1 enoyl-CoA hydratase/isomerase family protein [Mycolicibacterium goodii]MBU8831621.1 enoyl-CoA hydratase/isomerase family protein [Mycolicibacterium goodii]